MSRTNNKLCLCQSCIEELEWLNVNVESDEMSREMLTVEAFSIFCTKAIKARYIVSWVQQRNWIRVPQKNSMSMSHKNICQNSVTWSTKLRTFQSQTMLTPPNAWSILFAVTCFCILFGMKSRARSKAVSCSNVIVVILWFRTAT